MKQMKKLFAILMVVAMIAALSATAWATSTTAHTITVTSNGNGAHTYTAYQIFVGDLDATGTKLSNIEWGSGIAAADVDDLIDALKADTTLGSKFTAATYTAAEVADIVSGFIASEAEAFADVVEPFLSTAAGSASSGSAISVTGDGYYFIKDTGSIADGDTKTKFILQVLNDISVSAKDTVLTPDKEIDEVDGDDVNADNSDAAIGDLITFTVTIPVPDTTEYKTDFWFVMNDQLPAGMTFNSVSSIVVDPTGLNYNYMTGAGVTTTAKTGAGEYGAWTAPENAAAAVAATGGQAIKIVFNDFKDTVEADHDATTAGVQDLIGKNIVITYTAYLNNAATYGATYNQNTVTFDYSNDPNYDYNGSTPDGTGPTGTTPQSQTQTYVTTLLINKVDENNAALAGATFQINGTTWNYVLETGEKFEKSPYEAGTGETVQAGTYYKLTDGTYTTTASTTATAAQYVGDGAYVLVTYSKVIKQAGDNVTLTVVSDENGQIKLEGLKAGTYTVTETIAPTGYNLDSTVRTLVIDWSDTALATAGGFSIGSGSDSGFHMSENGAQFDITIQNQSGTTLPSTGGIGTTIFYVVGGILVAGALVVLITKKRMGEEN